MVEADAVRISARIGWVERGKQDFWGSNVFAVDCGNILLCTIYIWDTVIEMFRFWLLR